MDSLYTNVQRDPDGLPKWVCSRGTNKVESLHSRVHHLLCGNNNSPHHADFITLQVCGPGAVLPVGLPVGPLDAQLLIDDQQSPSHQQVPTERLRC
jgi:hypothetical protein